MIKILFIAPGNSVHSLRWIESASSKFKVYWISLHDFDEEVERIKCEAKVVKKFSFFSFFTTQLFIRNYIKDHDIDLVHVHSLARYGFAFYLTALTLKINTVLSAWGSDLIYGHTNIIKRFYLSGLMRRAKIIHVEGDHMRKLCIQIYPAANAKLRLIYFGTNTEFSRPNQANHRASSKVKFLSIRNLESIYNINSILSAFHEIQSAKYDFHLDILGHGSMEEELKNLSSALNLDKSVNFKGKVSQHEMLQLIQNSDVIISASASDAGLSASLGEALSCGKAILASDSGGENHLWIKEGVNGWLFDCNSSSDLAAKIELCIKNPLLLKEMGDRNRSIAIDHYDAATEMSKIHRIYSDLVDFHKLSE